MERKEVAGAQGVKNLLEQMKKVLSPGVYVFTGTKDNQIILDSYPVTADEDVKIFGVRFGFWEKEPESVLDFRFFKRDIAELSEDFLRQLRIKLENILTGGGQLS